MKVLLVVLALSAVLMGCEQKRAAENFADDSADQAANDAKKRGAWMWDKGRGNPLEQPPY